MRMVSKIELPLSYSYNSLINLYKPIFQLVYFLSIFSDKWIKDHGSEELKLPGFKGFSSKQMFWISFAQIYCSKWTDDGIFKLIASVDCNLNIHMLSS